MAERTHDPTAKKVREARGKGDVPRAPLLAGAVGLLVACAWAPSLARALVRCFSRALTTLQPTDRIDPWWLGSTLLGLIAPMCILLIGVAIVSGVVQGSIGFSVSRLAPDPSRLDPFGGLKNLIDKWRTWGAARGLLVLVVAVLVVYRTLLGAVALGARVVSRPSSAIDLASAMAGRAAMITAVVACAFAVIDVVVSRRLWLGRLKMTRDEVMREHKEGEGDPEVRRRREELHHELLAGEAISALRDATVVVVNPTHFACALRYDRGEGDDVAPTLVTKGQGALAARIVEAARFYGIPIVRDVPVARALYELETGVEIPEVLYEAVAEVLRAAFDDDPGA